jgi:hypothetical protein
MMGKTWKSVRDQGNINEACASIMHDLNNLVDMLYFFLFTALIAFLVAISALNVG